MTHASWCRFKALEALWINDNKLREIEGLHTNLQLKYLYVHNNNLGTLRGSLKNLSYLRTLCAYNNNLRDLQATLPFLSHLVHLENLDLFPHKCYIHPSNERVAQKLVPIQIVVVIQLHWPGQIIVIFHGFWRKSGHSLQPNFFFLKK